VESCRGKAPVLPVGSLGEGDGLKKFKAFVYESMNFCQRGSTEIYASGGIAIAEMFASVSLSVCPSHCGIVLKRTKLVS